MAEKIKSFEDLLVWQFAMLLAERIYALVRTFPADERFALCDQLKRAAVSIPSNIAEGFGRDTKADFLHFLAMARGSLFEVRTQFELARRVGYCASDQELTELAEGVGCKLSGLISKLKTFNHR